MSHRAPLPPDYTPERQCLNCGRMFTRRVTERVARFMKRHYCQRKCSTSATARKGVATKRKRAVEQFS